MPLLLLLALNHLSLPAIHYLHVLLDEAGEGDEAVVSVTPAHATTPPERHHHHHDDSHCAICQMIAAVRQHVVLAQISAAPLLERAPFPADSFPITAEHLDQTAEPLARGPPLA